MVPPFQVIIDCPFKDITKESTLTPIDNKYSLCMVNDFEDGKWNLEAYEAEIDDVQVKYDNTIESLNRMYELDLKLFS